MIKSNTQSLAEDMIHLLAARYNMTVMSVERLLGCHIMKYESKVFTLDAACIAMRGKITQPDVIIDTVCRHKKLSYDEINVESRKRDKVVARQLIMFLADKILYQWSDEQIATIFDKDRTTKIHAITVINNLIETDTAFCDEIKDIVADIARQYRILYLY